MVCVKRRSNHRAVAASSVVKQCLCGWADDLADEQLGLQLQPDVCVCACVSVYKSHSGLSVALKLVCCF